MIRTMATDLKSVKKPFNDKLEEVEVAACNWSYTDVENVTVYELPALTAPWNNYSYIKANENTRRFSVITKEEFYKHLG